MFAQPETPLDNATSPDLYLQINTAQSGKAGGGQIPRTHPKRNRRQREPREAQPPLRDIHYTRHPQAAARALRQSTHPPPRRPLARTRRTTKAPRRRAMGTTRKAVTPLPNISTWADAVSPSAASRSPHTSIERLYAAKSCRGDMDANTTHVKIAKKPGAHSPHTTTYEPNRQTQRHLHNAKSRRAPQTDPPPSKTQRHTPTTHPRDAPAANHETTKNSPHNCAVGGNKQT